MNFINLVESYRNRGYQIEILFAVECYFYCTKNGIKKRISLNNDGSHSTKILSGEML